MASSGMVMGQWDHKWLGGLGGRNSVSRTNFGTAGTKTLGMDSSPFTLGHNQTVELKNFVVRGSLGVPSESYCWLLGWAMPSEMVTGFTDAIATLVGDGSATALKEFYDKYNQYFWFQQKFNFGITTEESNPDPYAGVRSFDMSSVTNRVLQDTDSVGFTYIVLTEGWPSEDSSTKTVTFVADLECDSRSSL